MSELYFQIKKVKRIIERQNAADWSKKNIYYETVKYREFIPYPYTVESGKCFVLVDKRQSGEDSRYFGTVSKDEICGTVLTVVRSHNI